MTTIKTIPRDAYMFSATVQMEANNGTGSFSGIAYTGDILNHGFWGQVAFELSSISPMTHQIPMLIGHESAKNAGFADSVTISDQGIEVSGVLLSSKDGQRVKQDAKDGFVWQMSVHIEPETILEVEAGYEVNGRTFEKSGVVFQNTTIREISFTPIGVDSGTSTKVFSSNVKQFSHQGQSPTKKEGQPMTKEEAAALQAEKAELEKKFSAIAADMEAMKAATAATQKEARTVEVNQLFSDISLEKDDTQVAALASMDNAQFSAIATLMRSQKSKLPAHLFADSNIGEPEKTAGDDMVKSIVSAYEQGV